MSIIICICIIVRMQINKQVYKQGTKMFAVSISSLFVSSKEQYLYKSGMNN